MTTVETFDILKLTDEARNVVLDALANEEQSDGARAVGRGDRHARSGLLLRPLLLGPRRRARGRGDRSVTVA